MDSNVEEIMNESKLDTSEIIKLLKNVSRNYLRPGLQDKFNEYKEYIQANGFKSHQGLRPVLTKINREEIKFQLVSTILQIGLEHPSWACNQISEELKRLHIDVGASAVYNILIKHQMGTKPERIKKLQERNAGNLGELSAEQITTIEKYDPSFKDRELRGKFPGELLGQDTILLGVYRNIGELNIQFVVDSYSSYAFGFLHQPVKPDYAVTIMHNEVIPFFKKYNFPVKSMITDKGREYCGKDNHHYELYLRLNDIQHIISDKKLKNDGFLKRFIKIMKEEFIDDLVSEINDSNLKSLQAKLDQWLYYYNYQRGFNNYPNIGKPPFSLI